MRQLSFESFSRSSVLSRRIQAFMVSAVAATLLSMPAFADSEMEEAQIGYRQMLMGGIGADIGAISTILKNQMELPGHVENHARQIAASADLVGAAFKAKVVKGATDAKPKIWSDWSGFEEKIADLKSTANALADAAAKGDPAGIGAGIKALGESCGGCHDAYRKPKEESYKNQ